MTYSAPNEDVKCTAFASRVKGVRTGVDGRLADITDGSTLDHVPHSEPLDRLVLRDTARAVRAADEANMATALLVASVIPSLLSLYPKRNHSSASLFA